MNLAFSNNSCSALSGSLSSECSFLLDYYYFLCYCTSSFLKVICSLYFSAKVAASTLFAESHVRCNRPDLIECVQRVNTKQVKFSKKRLFYFVTHTRVSGCYYSIQLIIAVSPSLLCLDSEWVDATQTQPMSCRQQLPESWVSWIGIITKDYLVCANINRTHQNNI